MQPVVAARASISAVRRSGRALMPIRRIDRFALSARMPEALARGEFDLEYQPLVRLGDRRMIGVEALVRWTLPDGRRLDPAMFVPLAEDTGFIDQLGRWVLEHACRQAARWLAAEIRRAHV